MSHNNRFSCNVRFNIRHTCRLKRETNCSVRLKPNEHRIHTRRHVDAPSIFPRMRLTALAHPSLLCEYKKIPLLSDIEIMLQSEDSVICRESSRFSCLRKHHSQRRISSSSLDAACNNKWRTSHVVTSTTDRVSSCFHPSQAPDRRRSILPVPGCASN
jgi:hypothetical protein